jgi:uncharacterized ParB-like nuclease family protein
MADVNIDLIRDNPFRDFELHPIDEAQVAKLRASIKDLGFWSTVVARATPDGHYELAFGHHRVEAVRRNGRKTVPVTVEPLTDVQMALRLSVENAVQRGTTTAASLDAIAGVSRLVVRACWNADRPEEIWDAFPDLPISAARTIWGKVRNGGAPGRNCIRDLLPKGTYSIDQARLALNILRDSGRMALIVAEESGARLEPVDVTFDARCAHLFRHDYHLAEFHRFATDEAIRSYLTVDKQFEFAQRVVKAVPGEMTAIKLREQANGLLYNFTGVTRTRARRARERIADHRMTDLLNLIRRGKADIKKSCDMLGDLLAEEVDIPDAVAARFVEYVNDIQSALKTVLAHRKAHRANLKLIVNREGETP